MSTGRRLRCDGLNRRDFVQFGAGSLLGGSLLSSLHAATPVDSRRRRARNCIILWLDGGPSHLETFDLKPDAPAEVRGPFKPISTSVSGVQICELMPNTARMMDRVAIIRSMTSPLGEHNFGTHYLLTGYKPTPVLEYPTIGAVVAHTRGRAASNVGNEKQESVLPPHVAVPQFRVGGGRLSGHGFLPSTSAPFSVGGDPAKPNFRVRDLRFYPGYDESRVNRRKRYLAALDDFARQVDQAVDAGKGASSLETVDPQFEQAYRMVTSPAARRAFELSEEPNSVRKRYGGKTIGQSCLLARRLVERGTPFVLVNNRGWDTHNDMYTRLKEGYTGARIPVGLVPSLDLAFSALVEDLQERGLLDETLVVVMGEFGRTPKLNTAGGRDHWPRVFSVALAGGGVQGGQVIGSSDRTGEGPHDRPVTPADLASTIYTLLGVDPKHTLYTADGRPVRVSRDGKPVSEIV